MNKAKNRLLSIFAVFTLVFALFGVIFLARTPVKAEEPSAPLARATNAEVIAGIVANEANRTFDIKSAADETYATVSAGRFTVGLKSNGLMGDLTGYDDSSTQKLFVGYNAHCLGWSGEDDWASVTDNESYGWHKNVFLKLEIKKDAYLGLTHPAETRKADWANNGNEAAVQVVRIRDGKVKLLSEEWIQNRTEIPENALLHDAGNVKAGDVIFVASRGQYECFTYFNPVFAFDETREIFGATASNAQVIAGIAADETNRTYDVTDTDDQVYATVSAGYFAQNRPSENGVAGDVSYYDDSEKQCAFTNFTEKLLEGPDHWLTCDSNYNWLNDNFLKVEIKKDAYLGLTHPAETRDEGWANNGNEAAVQVVRIRGGKVKLLSEEWIQNRTEIPENALLHDAGNVKMGDVIFVALRGRWQAKARFNPVFTFEKTREIFGATATNAQAIAGIAANETDRIYDITDADDQVYATVSAGRIGDGFDYIDSSKEVPFNAYSSNQLGWSEADGWACIANTHDSDYCWQHEVYLKLTVKQDAYLAITHQAENAHNFKRLSI